MKYKVFEIIDSGKEKNLCEKKLKEIYLPKGNSFASVEDARREV
jgi:hypothetical protein